MDDYLRHSFFLVLVMSGIPLAACSVTGLIVSVLQTATQVSEQSIVFLVKFLTFGLVISFAYPIVLHELLVFFQRTIGSIALIGNMP